MKNKIFTLCIALFSFANLFAQEIETYLLDDFESGAVIFADEINVNPAAHYDIAVVDNPFKTGINTSNKVWEWARYDAEEENKIWAGFYAVLKNEIPAGYNRVEIKYLRTNATSQLKIKCEGAVTKEIASENSATKTNEWETMVFDLTANEILNVRVFGFFPDFYEPIDPTAKVYIDDIVFIKDGGVIVPPTPSVLFDNSASDRFHDQSWVNQTAPSTVVAEHWQVGSTEPGDKLPVVTSPVKDGANALKLQWKSVDAGDWKALVASIGFKSFDLTSMIELRFWVNSPVAMAKTALPMINLEAHSGNPNATGKLPMANYVPDGLAANTWTEVIVPLADLWASNADFVSKNVIKGVFFSQNATDNVEHTMYMDEFTFASAATGIKVPAASNKAITAYYSNGEVRISTYSGLVRVFNIVGSKIAEGPAYDGIFSVDLKTGIYIINTTNGNIKIAVK